MNLEPSLLEILVCPSCRERLRADAEADELACVGCGLVYPVVGGIPHLLVDEARSPGGTVVP